MTDEEKLLFIIMDHLKEHNPCIGCMNRFIGCHSQCPEFADWRKELEEVNRLKKLNAERYDDFNPRLDKLKRRRWH